MIYIVKPSIRYAFRRNWNERSNGRTSRESLSRVYPDEKVVYGPFQTEQDAREWCDFKGVEYNPVDEIPSKHRLIGIDENWRGN